MRKLFFFLMLVTGMVTAQPNASNTQIIGKYLKLPKVPVGLNTDNVLVLGSDNMVKFVPRSSFGGGIPTLQQVTTRSNTTTDKLIVQGIGIGGRNDSNGYSVFIGHGAGDYTPNANLLTALGEGAGGYSSGLISLALGSGAGVSNTGNYSIAAGFGAGTENKGNYSIAIGGSSGYNNQGDNSIHIGGGAGYNNIGPYSLSTGFQAGFKNTGDSVIAIGRNTGQSNSGNDAIQIGQSTGTSNTGSNVIMVGREAGISNTFDYVTLLGLHTTATQDNQLVLSSNSGNNNIRFNTDVSTDLSFQFPSTSGTLGLVGTSAPTSSSDTGTTGEIRVVSGYIYWCIAPNTWIRAEGTTF